MKRLVLAAGMLILVLLTANVVQAHPHIQCPQGFRVDCKCVRINTPPRPCPPHMIWNAPQNRCVPRCQGPVRWDPAQRRCVARCPQGTNYYHGKCLPRCRAENGQRWDQRTKRCVSVCQSGWYWDWKRRVCLKRCPGGYMWAPDAWLRRCVRLNPNRAKCPQGWHYIGREMRCFPYNQPRKHCPPGQFWNFYNKRCENGPPRPRCPQGMAWSNFWDGCVRP